MLYQSENKFIVLERGVRLTKGGINYTGGLYLADMTGAKDISAVKSLADGKSAGMKKQLLVDLEDVLKNRKMENYEGLAWGPTLPDGRKSLLVIADSNQKRKQFY